MNPAKHMNTAPSFLLQWLSHHSMRTRPQIKMACRSLALNYGKEPKNAFYSIFMPLVRMGMVEFAGNGNYQLAPSLVLQHNSHQCLTLINPGVAVKTYVKSNFDSVEPLYNFVRFQCYPEQLATFLELHPIPILKDDVTGLLTQFPDVRSVIRQLPSVSPHSNKKFFYDPFTFSMTSQILPFGIYKSNEDAQVYYFQDTDEQTYKLPVPQINPEMFSIALCYQVSLMKRLHLRYDEAIQKLYMPKFFLPPLLERILRIPSLSTCETWPTQEMEVCLSGITKNHLQSLQRILCLTH
jgi:hypothetical protein